MTFYDIATVWIILGVFTYVDHVVYCWDFPALRKHLVEVSTFILYVVYWPMVLASTMYLRYRVHVAFRQFLKENPTL